MKSKHKKLINQKIDLLDVGIPTPAEGQVLDDALAEFERDPEPGQPWRKVFREIRASHQQ